MFPDYYKILDLPSDASEFQIKKSFRSKIKELHPDNNPLPDARTDFVQAYEAYEILVHPNTRKLYNSDLVNGHTPETHQSCAYFIRYAHSIADEHASLKYPEVTKTKFYKSTRTLSYLVFFSDLIIGLLVIIAPIVMFQYIMPIGGGVLSIVFVFAGVLLGLVLLSQAYLGMGSYRKFKNIPPVKH
jgi:curved DNA-binding protein CbpA